MTMTSENAKSTTVKRSDPNAFRMETRKLIAGVAGTVAAVELVDIEIIFSLNECHLH